MAKNLNPKCKQCRRIGEKLFLKGERCFSPKCAMVKKNYPPGYHGQKRFQKKTEYGLQLQEKQKAKKKYGVLEKQFSNYYKKAIWHKGDTGYNLLNLLETRLDNVVYRLGLAKSRGKARQIVRHGFVFVNNRKVDIPSCQVKVGDTVYVKESKLNTSYFIDIQKAINKQTLPSWLAFLDVKKLNAKVVSKPTEEEVKQDINVALIIEYYSR